MLVCLPYLVTVVFRCLAGVLTGAASFEVTGETIVSICVSYSYVVTVLYLSHPGNRKGQLQEKNDNRECVHAVTGRKVM